MGAAPTIDSSVFQSHCQWKQPPGKEIYRRSNVSVYEVDGRDHKVSRGRPKPGPGSGGGLSSASASADLLSEPLSAGKTLPGPQDALL